MVSYSIGMSHVEHKSLIFFPDKNSIYQDQIIDEVLASKIANYIIPESIARGCSYWSEFQDKVNWCVLLKVWTASY